MGHLKAQEVVKRHGKARERRAVWEPLWRECYDFAMPQRDGFVGNSKAGSSRSDKLFDGTAPDAVDQLGASLLAQLTPPWSVWFGLQPGIDVEEAEEADLAKTLEETSKAVRSNLERSNFSVEMHQCFLDLVTVGTATLLVEEAPIGESSAFRFTAVPMAQMAFEEGASGRLDTAFRQSTMPVSVAEQRFGKEALPKQIRDRASKNEADEVTVIEAVSPSKGGHDYMAVLEDAVGDGRDATVLKEGRFASSPFITFRWLKAPGEIYGRSPVMKAMPDIKTANKVVELILKNASIAVTGIWQADDDGVLNPATIKLAPGTIIPKAVGSAGLTPLESPGRFDLSNLVLDQLRVRIRTALLAEQLGQVKAPNMTATEVLERSAEISRLLGATYGRLQSELLTPLVMRCLGILERRGEIAPIRVDGRLVELQYKSPLARAQSKQEADAVMRWIENLGLLGPDAFNAVDKPAVARFLASAHGVPPDLVVPEAPQLMSLGADLAGLGEAVAQIVEGGGHVQP